jgi:hypothetical protein
VEILHVSRAVLAGRVFSLGGAAQGVLKEQSESPSLGSRSWMAKILEKSLPYADVLLKYGFYYRGER